MEIAEYVSVRHFDILSRYTLRNVAVTSDSKSTLNQESKLINGFSRSKLSRMTIQDTHGDGRLHGDVPHDDGRRHDDGYVARIAFFPAATTAFLVMCCVYLVTETTSPDKEGR